MVRMICKADAVFIFVKTQFHDVKGPTLFY